MLSICLLDIYAYIDLCCKQPWSHMQLVKVLTMRDWGHNPRQNFSTTFHYDRGSGNIVEEEAERKQELEDREAYYEILLSEYIYHSH